MEISGRREGWIWGRERNLKMSLEEDAGQDRVLVVCTQNNVVIFIYLI